MPLTVHSYIMYKVFAVHCNTVHSLESVINTVLISSHCDILYRNVMRDVTRLLYLLNKKSSAIEIPPDGLQLLSWSEQILHRYLASKVHTWMYMLNNLQQIVLYVRFLCSLHTASFSYKTASNTQHLNSPWYDITWVYIK